LALKSRKAIKDSLSLSLTNHKLRFMDFDFTGYFWSVCKATRSIFVPNTPTKFFVSLHSWHMAFWKQTWEKCGTKTTDLGYQNLMIVFIQSRKYAILVITPGWFLLAHPMPHEIIPAKSNLPFSRLTAIGPPESPLVNRRIQDSAKICFAFLL